MAELMQTIPWWVKAVVTAVISVLGTLYTINYSFNKNDKQDILKRVTIVESQQQKLEAHQQDQSEKVDHIQAQVDRLVEWALGKK